MTAPVTRVVVVVTDFGPVEHLAAEVRAFAQSDAGTPGLARWTTAASLRYSQAWPPACRSPRSARWSWPGGSVQIR